jgi:signal peptidase I
VSESLPPVPDDPSASPSGFHPVDPAGASDSDPAAPTSVPEPPPPEPVPTSRNVRRGVVRDYAETLLVAVLVVLFLTTFGMQNSVIPTPSMEDTLLVGDYLFVNKIVFAPVDAAAPTPWLAQRPIERGDIVVFKFPKDPGIDYIKRVMGLPGDVMEMRKKQVIRNGEVLVEPQKRNKTAVFEAARDDFAPITVPEGSLFVMGDNRDFSADSRDWGFVPRENVEGRAFVVFWSRAQRPGAWQLHGVARFKRFGQAVATFYRDTRWRRMFTLVR